jgi:hypothetical protein
MGEKMRKVCIVHFLWLFFSFFFFYTISLITLQFCRELFFDEEGNLLDEKPKDPREVARRKKISDSRNKFEDLLQMAKNSDQGLEFLFSSLCNLVEPLQNITPPVTVDKKDEYEAFLGSKIPNQVDIHPPNDIKSKGRCKRIKKGKELKESERKGKGERMCRKCKQVGGHDARNCPNNVS